MVGENPPTRSFPIHSVNIWALWDSLGHYGAWPIFGQAVAILGKSRATPCPCRCAHRPPELSGLLVCTDVRTCVHKCVCTCVRRCAHICAQVCAHVCTGVRRRCARVCASVRTCVHRCVHTCAQVCAHVCTDVRTCVHKCVCTCLRRYAHMCAQERMCIMRKPKKEHGQGLHGARWKCLSISGTDRGLSGNVWDCSGLLEIVWDS